MSFQEELAALRERIAKAESERDRWRSAGSQEKYLEAYSTVEALELQLERLRHAGPAPALKSDATLPEPERSMAELFIAFNGRHYFYGSYRYERLADAVSYARLQRSRPGGADVLGAMPAPQQLQPPSESQRELMSALGITYHDGVYRLGAYRYDRLADAVDYAGIEGKT